MPTPATATVRIDVPLDAAWRRASLVLGSAAGMTLAAWVCAWLTWPASAAAAAMAALAAAGAAAGARALRAPVGTLRRHGDAWWWHDVGAADTLADGGARGDVIVTIDLGRWMLVRFDPVDEPIGPIGPISRVRSRLRRRRPLWLPLSAAAAAAAGTVWTAWRALLLSRRATMPARLQQAAARTDR